MVIAIGSDHAGYEQKIALVVHAQSLGHTVLDCGPNTEVDSVDYPDYAAAVCSAVVNGRAQRGILVCGTGIGMAIAANKCESIRAANVVSQHFAQLCREHNDANVITLSGRFVSLVDNRDIVDVFLNTPFGTARHARRVEKMMELETWH